MTRRSTPIPRPQGYHHGDLRRALLLAARKLVELGGSPALTLRAAAQQAGVSPAAPYRHFEDRDALLAAVLAEGFRELAATLEAARVSVPAPIDSYLAVGSAYLQFAAGNPRLYRLMFGSECNKLQYPDLLEAGQEAFAVVVRAAHQCAAAGLAGSHSPDDVALAGWSVVHGLASLQTDGVLERVTPRPLPDVAQALFSILVGGVVPR
ncbi:MAG: TetR/AcrR family transcriptional regulator [Xanthomonadales bacterium]|nr:TetR/AcrR family transcriptional regulator [Xanthomonadales bacterium]